ncbi:MAG TPA: class I SAM-dependent methyltransferase [Candidatus Angelobacter sp.]|nr:class I SAM-dependent methyltransferase [Candidatus Angelobacter sp.]
MPGMDSSAKLDWNRFGRANAARQWRKQSAAMGRHMTELIVEAAEVAHGMRILDVACGAGEPSISLGMRLEGTGEVIGVDIAPESLKIAEERAAQQQLTNTRFQYADVHELPFPDGTFDRITSRLGVMFFADLPKATHELLRVLKPQGKIVLMAWGPMEQPYFATMAGTVLRTLPDATIPGSAQKVFSFARTGALSSALRDAGFRSADEKNLTIPWTWPGTPEDAWAYFQELAVPFAPLLQSIPPERRAEVDEAVLRAISQYYDGSEIKFTAIVNVASATK